MQTIDNIAAVFFDMDGTLLDSETLTEPAIVELCREHGISDPGLDCTRLYGVAWLEIERILQDRHPALRQRRGLADRLHGIYHRMLVDAPPPLIRLARESVLAANRLMPTAIVSASGRASIEATMRRMNIGDAINFYAGAEDYARPKPAPDGYLAAAAAVGVDPGACLVFEDSIPGMQSARNAGMQLIAVTHRCNDIERATALSDAVIRDYADLDEQFFSRICGGTSQR